MKIFISWSGERSGIIAKGLSVWLPNVIQSIEIFYSPSIEKGTRGGAEINAVLEQTNFGIICLTRENLQNNWIHYEAGALAKINGQETRVWTLLHGLKHSDVVQPLAQFQHTLTEKEDIYDLLKSINSKQEKPLLEEPLRRTFDKWWSDLDEIIKTADAVTDGEVVFNEDDNIRSQEDILNEILEILRNQERDKYVSIEMGLKPSVGDLFIKRVVLRIKTLPITLERFQEFTAIYFGDKAIKVRITGDNAGYLIDFPVPQSRQLISEYIVGLVAQEIEITSYKLLDTKDKITTIRV